MLQPEEKFERCRWPELDEPYNTALRQATRFILEQFEDTLGIIISGTILRGQPAPSSDLDIYVIRQQPKRQRIQRFFNDVPAEIFVNPVSKVLDYFDQERQAGRPITAHMLATGHTILDLDPVLADLRELSEQILSQPPDLGAEQLTTARYLAATRYEDALDIAADRPATATMILSMAVRGMIKYYFLKANRYLPRDKDLLLALSEFNPKLSNLTREFYTSSDLDERLHLAEQIADQTIETHGFFEWTSKLQLVE